MENDVNDKEVQAFTDLIQGYEQRVNTVTRYMTQAADLLCQLAGEQDVMIAQLKDMLAARCSFRHKDFDGAVRRVVAKRRERLAALPGLIEDFRHTEQGLVDKVRQLLTGNAADVARAWPELKQEMLSLQRMRERNVSRMLKRAHIEQEELCRGLKGLLSKGEKIRIADLKAVMREINAISPQEMTDLADVFRDCQSACAEVSEAWANVV